MVGFFIAMISGALMSIQGVFNTQVTKTAGEWTTNVFVQFTAMLVGLVAWGVRERNSFAQLWQVQPKYLLAGGIIGALITMTVIKGMSSLGPAMATMIIVISQITVSYLVELFGLFGTSRQPFEIRKLFGLLLAVAGVFLFNRD